MKTHLIIYAHPNEQSFNHAMLEKTIQASEAHNVIVRDLYQLHFNPILTQSELQASFSKKYAQEVLIEQQYWQQADLITLIYPIWWSGFPAILKGYLDRILTFGFAYTDGETESIGLLQGKTMQQFVTLGNSNEKYQQAGVLAAFDKTLGNGLFNFCGIQEVKMHYFGEIGQKSTDYSAILQEVEKQTREALQKIS